MRPDPLALIPPEYLTIDEIAARLNVSRMTVYRLVEKQELRAYRFGRQFRVDPRDLAVYVREANTVVWERPIGGRP